MNHYIEVGDNPDLTAERVHCPFDTHALSAVFYGGHQAFRRRQQILDCVESTPELRDLQSDTTYGSKLDWVQQSFHNHVVAKQFQDKIIDKNERAEYEWYKRLTVGFAGAPGTLSDVIVIPLLEECCDEEQRKLFLEPAKSYRFYTAYAQTELGHGTNTKELGTTATFDPSSQEFVLNTPGLASYKWWPGNLGAVASWCVVMARLITNDADHGMHPFFVQIRDEATHRPLRGVEVGEIGTNFGLPANDNGFLALHEVRVPRVALLAKHFSVEPDGSYVAGVHPRLAYVGMMFVRAAMIDEIMGQSLAAAATIATRYSCVRRQGEIEIGAGEVKILDYRTQQYRVLPQICRALCFMLGGQISLQMYYQMCNEIKHGDPSLMEDVHAITSGLKALCSYQVAQGIEQCRLACGGHGYSMGSGVPQIYTFAVGGCTYEGDNLVMLLQLARYLIKRASEAKKGRRPRRLAPFAEHLFQAGATTSTYNKDSNRHQKWLDILLAFDHLSRRLTFRGYQLWTAEKKAGVKPDIAWNNVSIELIKASKAYTRSFLARAFFDSVQAIKNKSVKEVLSDCLDVYLNYEVLDCRADLLEDSFFSGDQLNAVRSQLVKAFDALRPNAVNVVDSFDIPDRYLNSQIGSRDGNSYENLYNWALRSPLNQHYKLPFHDITIGQMMTRNRQSSKL